MKEAFMRFLGILLSLASTILFAGEIVLVDIPNSGQIQYEYTDGKLVSISRVSKEKEVLYSHSYQYDEENHLISETLIGNLGTMQYLANHHTLICLSPYSSELVEYNPEGILTQLIDGESRRNDPTSKNVTCEYNTKGNLIRKNETLFFYDEKDRLIQVVQNDKEVAFKYNDRSERISKTVIINNTSKSENSYYIDGNEIAIFSETNELKQLRIPGITFSKGILRPIAIEVGEDIYAPILDRQGNILKLVNIKTFEIISYTKINLWGDNLKKLAPITPWVFGSKHYDPEVDLIYFGHRYYDPELKKWISPDPLGNIQSNDLYQYCLGDPLRYIDPDGKFAIVIPIIWGGATLAEVLIDAAIIGGTSWLGYEAVKHGNELMESHKDKEGKQKDGTPKNNQAQNNQFKDAVKNIERNIGKKLTDKQIRELHNEISKQGYGYHDIVEEGSWMFK